MKVISLLSLTLLFVLIVSNNAFGDNKSEDFGVASNEEKTIREMGDEISELKKTKQRLEFKWNTFRIGNSDLGDFIKKEISEEDKLQLEELVLLYIRSNEKLEKSKSINVGSFYIKQKILTLKQEFYKSLLPYIEVSKLEDFTYYVESDLEYNEKSKEVGDKIYVETEKREDRIEEIQEQIADNKKILRDQITFSVKEKITFKLEEFVLQDKFDSLSNEAKIKIFEKLRAKIQLLIDRTIQIENPTSLIEEKIILYELVSDILESFIFRWQ